MGSVRDNQDITFPPVTCLLVRLCTRKVQDPFFRSVNGCFRKTSPRSDFAPLKMVSWIPVLLGDYIYIYLFFLKKEKDSNFCPVFIKMVKGLINFFIGTAVMFHCSVL